MKNQEMQHWNITFKSLHIFKFPDFEFALDKMSKPVEMKKLADLPESSYQR